MADQQLPIPKVVESWCKLVLLTSNASPKFVVSTCCSASGALDITQLGFAGLEVDKDFSLAGQPPMYEFVFNVSNMT